MLLLNSLLKFDPVSATILSVLHLTFLYFQHSGVNSSDAQVLTVYNVTEEESGEYICKVSNYIGEANQSAWLTVTRYEPTGNHYAAVRVNTVEALLRPPGKTRAV